MFPINELKISDGLCQFILIRYGGVRVDIIRSSRNKPWPLNSGADGGAEGNEDLVILGIGAGPTLGVSERSP